MRQLTEQEAIDLAKTEFWKDMTPRQIAEFQFLQDRMCMPWDVFHAAMEKTLERQIWTHEFSSLGKDQLWAELFAGADAPTFEQIVEQIPEEKRIVIQL